MARSIASSLDAQCPTCSKPMRPTAWVIVDFEERPELLEVALEGRLQTATCPACKTATRVNGPLMLHVPGAVPPLIFSPMDGSTLDEIDDQEKRLLAALGRDGIVDVEELPLSGPWWILPTLLRHAMSGRVAQDLVSCTVDDPSAEDSQLYELCIRNYRARRIRQSFRAIFSQLAGWGSFLNARRLIAGRPELRSDDALTLLTKWVGEATAEGQLGASRMNNELRNLLARVQAIGVEAAFDEYARQLAAGQVGPVIWTGH